MPGNARSPLSRIVVTGSGPVALGAAIALRRALPQADIVLVPAPLDPAALADRASTTLPSSNAFHRRIGLDEAGLVIRAGASHRLAVEFKGWRGTGGDGLFAYGAATPDGLGDTAGPAVSGALALAGRFAHPADEASSPLSDLDYALRFNPGAYCRHLTLLAGRLGVRSRDAELRAAVAGPDGKIAHLNLANGEDITGELFVDCTGPAARIASALPDCGRDSWAQHLPCDRLLIAPAREPEFTPRDRLAATPLGWRATVHGRDGSSDCCAYNNETSGSAEQVAAAAGAGTGSVLTVTPGRLTRIWQGNVISFGDAAAQFEPLHWANLALAHAQILLFLELLPGRETHPLEQAEFNRRAGLMADRLRDFLALHYCGLRRAEGPFWERAAQLVRSDALHLTLDEYRRRGRMPFFEEDPLPRDAWVAALAAVGIAPAMPARWLAVPAEQRGALAEAHRQRAAAAVRLAQPYPQWLGTYLEKAR